MNLKRANNEPYIARRKRGLDSRSRLRFTGMTIPLFGGFVSGSHLLSVVTADCTLDTLGGSIER